MGGGWRVNMSGNHIYVCMVCVSVSITYVHLRIKLQA